MVSPSGINALIPLSGDQGIGFSGAKMRGQAMRGERQRQDILEEERESIRSGAAKQAAALAEFESMERGVRKLGPLVPRSIEQVPDFVRAIDERIAEIESTGGDPSDTMEIRAQAVAGDFEGIQKSFSDVIEIGRQLRANELGATLPGQQNQARSRLAASRPSRQGEQHGQTVISIGPDGKVNQEFVEFAEGVEPTDVQGETPSQRRDSEAEQKRRIAEEKGTTDRRNKVIDEGTAAANGLGSLNRGIDLLSQVSTGAPQAARLWVKRTLGVETADEGELSNLLGKAVLSQLRATFGAQFTQEEGNRLVEIEANFSKNVASNMRLLQNARDIAMRAAEDGRRAAMDVGDDFTVRQIEAAMEFELGTGAVEPPATETIQTSNGATVTFDQ